MQAVTLELLEKEFSPSQQGRWRKPLIWRLTPQDRSLSPNMI
jgi:hypothetical protein